MHLRLLLLSAPTASIYIKACVWSMATDSVSILDFFYRFTLSLVSASYLVRITNYFTFGPHNDTVAGRLTGWLAGSLFLLAALMPDH